MPNWLTMNTWIISDTHFGHDNIVEYCDRPKNHDFLIYDNWKRIVGSKDPIFHLGDLTVWYGMKQEPWELLALHLPGKKKLLKGNHDPRSDEEYAALGYTVVEPMVVRVGVHRILFTHEPCLTPSENWDINIHGHVHNNGHRNEGLDELPPWCKNVSIEVMNYVPVKLGDIL